MFKTLKLGQVRFIALLARVARSERDALLGNISAEDLGEPKAARGEHNPTEPLGFEPLPLASPQMSALREAITGLPRPAHAELYALMRIGQGQAAAGNWDQVVSEAETLGDQTVDTLLTEDVDLHDHLSKALYELRLAA